MIKETVRCRMEVIRICALNYRQRAGLYFATGLKILTQVRSDKMISDLMSYGLLAAIFVVTGLRAFFDKPNKTTEIPLQHWKGRDQTVNQ